MAGISEEQVIGMFFDPNFESGGDSEINEDVAFPLPEPEDENPLYRHRIRRGSMRDTEASVQSENEVEEEWEGEEVRGRVERRVARGRRGRRGRGGRGGRGSRARGSARRGGSRSNTGPQQHKVSKYI